MTMQAVWTIEVGGTSRRYKNAKFSRALKKDGPTTFSAQIEYASPVVSFFDLVEIKRNGTTEWKGYVETISIEWDESGRFYNLSGRNTSLIIWKKYNEGFTSYAEGIEGFFGKVNASELIKFLLRTPRSDLPTESDLYKYNKAGWGLDFTNFTEMTAARTSYGDPLWTILRKRSVAGWRNVGTPYNADTLNVTTRLTSNWDTLGSDPYLDVDNDNSYIYSGTLNETEDFQLENLDASATGINSAKLTVTWKPDGTWWFWINSETEVWVSKDGGSTWACAGSFGGRFPPTTSYWRNYTYDLSEYITKVSECQGGNLRIRFKCINGSLTNYITYAAIVVSYSSGGVQSLYDYFSATFNKEDICGVYFESRADDESYPRHYEIVSLTDTIEQWVSPSPWTETDPNSHIALQDSYRTIEHDSYSDESAYYSRDYGLDAIDTFDYSFSFKIVSAENNNDLPIFVPFVVTQWLNDFYSIKTSSYYYIGFYIQYLGGVPQAWIERGGGGSSSGQSCYTIAIGTQYYVRVFRSGATVTCLGYSDSSMSSTFQLWEKTVTLSSSSTKYQYRIQASSANATVNLEEAFDDYLVCNGKSDPWDIDEWDKTGSSPYLNDADGSNYISADYPDDYGLHQSYFTFNQTGNIPALAKYSSMAISSVQVGVMCKVSGSFDDGLSIGVYIWDGSAWTYTGGHNVDTTDWTLYWIDCTSILNTQAKLNAARMKVGFMGYGGTPTSATLYCTFAELEVQGTGYWTETYHTLGYVYTQSPEEIVLVADTDNSTTGYRDIVHSWSPQNIGNIRIKITGDDSHAWVITQFYLYKAEDLDYRVTHEDSSTPTFDLNQYIHEIVIDDDYGEAIGPLNVEEGRMIDQINSTLKIIQESSVPYDWYMDMNANNTFHICERQGEDLDITFAFGSHLEKSEREDTVEDTYQRVKVKGSGEGSNAESVSSGWLSDVSSMSNVNSFYESIESSKSIPTAAIAGLVGDAELTEHAPPITSIKVDVSKDDNDSMDYDVGDTALLTDANIGFTASRQKIYNIAKSIDNDGEHVTLYCGFPYLSKEDALREIVKRIKNLELSGGITGGWTSQEKGSMISVTKVEDLWEKTAKENTADTGNDKTDPKWKVGSWDHGSTWELGDNGIIMYGPNSSEDDQVHTTVDYWYDRVSTNEDGSVGTDVEYLITPNQNPKIEFEFSAFEHTSGTPEFWRSGDQFEVGLAKDTAGYVSGAWFRFVSIGSSLLEVYALWRDIGGTEQPKFMATISAATKYRFVITYDKDKKYVIWEMWDLANNAKYPLVAVRSGLNTDDLQSVHPLYMNMYATWHSGNYRAVAILYHVKITYERVQMEMSGGA